MRIRPIAKIICQTVLEYFNMEKYGYIHHIMNMFVLQNMHITGISHTDTSSIVTFLLRQVLHEFLLFQYYYLY